MFFKPVVAVLALVFGFAGMVACVAGAYGVWRVQSRLDRANDKVFDTINRSLEVVEDRIPIVQQRIGELQITTTEVTEAVQEWVAKKGQDHIVSQLQIESRIEKLSGHLQAADLRLEVSMVAVGDIRQLLELAENLRRQREPSLDRRSA